MSDYLKKPKNVRIDLDDPNRKRFIETEIELISRLKT